MDASEYQDYVRRITDGETVAEVHKVVEELKAEHPNDPDCDALESTGLTVAAGILQEWPQRRLLPASEGARMVA